MPCILSGKLNASADPTIPEQIAFQVMLSDYESVIVRYTSMLRVNRVEDGYSVQANAGRIQGPKKVARQVRGHSCEAEVYNRIGR
jgi:hypothetical protein